MKKSTDIPNRFFRLLKRQLFTYLVIIAFAVANPDFSRAEAQFSPKETRDKGGFYFFLEGRFAFSNGDETPFAEPRISFEVNPFTIDPEEGGGGSTGIGYRFGKLDFGIAYSGLWMFDRTGDVTTQFFANFGGDPPKCEKFSGSVCPVGPLTPGLVNPILGNVPGTLDYAYFFANAEAELTYHVMDFEAGYNLKLGETDIRLFAGARYANFDQNVNTNFFTPTYTTSGGLGGGFYYFMSEKRNVDFWGIGPRLGVSGRSLVRGPFGLQWSISGAALFGNKDTLTTQNQTIGDPIIGFTRVSRSKDQTVGNLEGELGLTYRGEISQAMTMVFTLGYRAESWFGVNDTSNEFSAQGFSFGKEDADQFFHGPFLRGEIRFR